MHTKPSKMHIRIIVTIEKIAFEIVGEGKLSFSNTPYQIILSTSKILRYPKCYFYLIYFNYFVDMCGVAGKRRTSNLNVTGLRPPLESTFVY